MGSAERISKEGQKVKYIYSGGGGGQYLVKIVSGLVNFLYFWQLLIRQYNPEGANAVSHSPPPTQMHGHSITVL